MNKKEADTQTETSEKPKVNEDAGDTQENANTAKAQESKMQRQNQQKIPIRLRALQKKISSHSI